MTQQISLSLHAHTHLYFYGQRELVSIKYIKKMNAGIGIDCRWFVHTMQTHLNMERITIDVLYFIHLFLTNKEQMKKEHSSISNFLYCKGIQQ